MAVLTPGTTLSASSEDGGWRLSSSDDVGGRIRGSDVEFGDLDLRLQRTGERYEFVTGVGTPVLRFDPAGAKAVTLTTSSARFRLARQRPRPLRRLWRLTRDVHGHAILTVTQTPLGTRLRTAEDADVPPGELAVLALAALVEVLDVAPATRIARHTAH